MFTDKAGWCTRVGAHQRWEKFLGASLGGKGGFFFSLLYISFGVVVFVSSLFFWNLRGSLMHDSEVTRAERIALMVVCGNVPEPEALAYVEGEEYRQSMAEWDSRKLAVESGGGRC